MAIFRWHRCQVVIPLRSSTNQTDCHSQSSPFLMEGTWHFFCCSHLSCELSKSSSSSLTSQTLLAVLYTPGRPSSALSCSVSRNTLANCSINMNKPASSSKAEDEIYEVDVEEMSLPSNQSQSESKVECDGEIASETSSVTKTKLFSILGVLWVCQNAC